MCALSIASGNPNILCNAMQMKQLEDVVKRMQASKQSVPTSVHQLLDLLPYLAVVVVQDALELAEKFPTAHAHKLLLENITFK